MEKKYSDPHDLKDHLKKLYSLSSPDEIQTFIENIFPGWLLISTPEYSKDYSYLQDNWDTICKLNHIKPQKIVIVDFISFDDNNYSLLQSICEIMTKKGYVVRRKGEFTGCSICDKAIPTENVWRMMKNKNLPVPSVWSDKCSEHSKK